MQQRYEQREIARLKCKLRDVQNTPGLLIFKITFTFFIVQNDIHLNNYISRPRQTNCFYRDNYLILACTKS